MLLASLATQSFRNLAVSWSSGQKILSLNGKAVPVVRYLGNLDALLMSFDQLPVVRGSPGERRRFLDRGIMQLKKTYLQMLAEFHHALRQRNRLLELIRASEAHRDDLRILIEQREIEKFGSGGQQRSAVFALILAAMKLYFIENNDYPVLLLDDLDAELDVTRLEALLGCLETANQVFVSCAKKTILDSIGYCARWEVREGVLGTA